MIIRKLRLDKGLSQELLAEMAGISPRTLQRIERGANASPETLKCLAAVLEVDFSTLREKQLMTNPANPVETPTSITPEIPIAQPTGQPAPHAPMEPQPQAATLPELSDEEREAMEYVRDIKSFYTHAIQYGVVMVVLLVINLMTSPGYFWVVWPAMGWGIGLTIHGLNVFEVFNFFGDNWEKKQIKRRMRR